MLTVPASHKVQGRSASGRNGGARNTTNSNKEAMRDFALVFVAVYKFAFGSVIGCFGKPQQSFSCLRAVQL